MRADHAGQLTFKDLGGSATYVQVEDLVLLRPAPNYEWDVFFAHVLSLVPAHTNPRTYQDYWDHIRMCPEEMVPGHMYTGHALAALLDPDPAISIADGTASTTRPVQQLYNMFHLC